MARQKRKHQSVQQQSQQALWFILGLAGIAVILLILIGMMSRSQEVKTADVSLQGIPVSGKTIGYPDAPVEVWDFSDFHCPHCREFAFGPEQQLIQEYVKTGKVKFTFRHFIVVDSYLPANASECANEQGQFWAYHNYLYKKQETDAPFSKEELKQYARDLGLNTKAFDACVDSGKYMNVVLKETDEGRGLGVMGTPTIFVNGQYIERGMFWDVLKAAVDRALQEANQ